MSLIGLMAPAATAEPADSLDPSLHGVRLGHHDQPVRPGAPATRGGPRHRAPAGTDEDADGENRETEAQRDVLLAATWHLDPALLVGKRRDSDATTAARRQLADIDARLGDVLEGYDRARTDADDAAGRADAATAGLTEAQAVATAAAAEYAKERDLLTSVITEAYTTGSAGSFGMLFSADSDQDLVTGMVLLQQMGRTQSAAVRGAEQASERLQAAAVAVAEADRRAEEQVLAAEASLAQAEAARRRVLADVKAARTLLEDSVLADQVAAVRARSEKAAAAALAALGRGFVAGEAGDISFPLPAEVTFVDQDNWGEHGSRWAAVHTGDDFSTGCGTPVLAVTDGVIMIRTDQSWSGPWLVMVNTGAGRLSTWYAHMEALLVTDGELVRAGQTIGVVGEEGNASGCHLHFEVHPTGGTIYEDNTNPVTWLDAVGAHPGVG